MGLIAFRDSVISQAKVKERLVALVLEQIRRERHNEGVLLSRSLAVLHCCLKVIDRTMLRNITKMLVDLGIETKSVYESAFEEPFLAESTEFFNRESQKLIGQCSCPEYLRKVARMHPLPFFNFPLLDRRPRTD